MPLIKGMKSTTMESLFSECTCIHYDYFYCSNSKRKI